MIKIELTVNEEKIEDYDEIVATSCGVQVKEILKNATRMEKKCSELLKSRLKFSEKIELIDETKSQDAFEKILKKIL